MPIIYWNEDQVISYMEYIRYKIPNLQLYRLQVHNHSEYYFKHKTSNLHAGEEAGEIISGKRMEYHLMHKTATLPQN